MSPKASQYLSSRRLYIFWIVSVSVNSFRHNSCMFVVFAIKTWFRTQILHREKCVLLPCVRQRGCGMHRPCRRRALCWRHGARTPPGYGYRAQRRGSISSEVDGSSPSIWSSFRAFSSLFVTWNFMKDMAPRMWLPRSSMRAAVSRTTPVREWACVNVKARDQFVSFLRASSMVIPL